MKRKSCPICGGLIVPAAGPANSDILLVGEFPGHYEMQQGIPFVGPSGDILKEELARAGISYGQCRVTNLWLHGKKEKDEAELAWHMGQLAAELDGRKYVLLMGSDVCSAFLGPKESVMDWSGMVVKSDYLPKSVRKAVVSPNPALLMHDTTGEFRLALQRFKEIIG